MAYYAPGASLVFPAPDFCIKGNLVLGMSKLFINCGTSMKVKRIQILSNRIVENRCFKGTVGVISSGVSFTEWHYPLFV